MQAIAILIGGTIMAGAGLLVMLLIAWLIARLVADAAWRGSGAWLTLRQLEQAVSEWRERHPEEAARAKKRHEAQARSTS